MFFTVDNYDAFDVKTVRGNQKLHVALFKKGEGNIMYFPFPFAFDVWWKYEYFILGLIIFQCTSHYPI